MRRSSLLIAVVSVACSATPVATTSTGRQMPPPPSASLVAPAPSAGAPITVAIVVDQLAAWVARDRLGLLPNDGGFARLRREGTWYQDVRFAHAATETAPGHASLFSGKVPREHGIVSNELWLNDRVVPIVADNAALAITSHGERPEGGASLRALTTEVVADRLKAQTPDTRVYSLSLKDRAALFGGGMHSDLSLWYDAKSGDFLSTNQLTRQLPAWLLPAIAPDALKARLSRVWHPLAEDCTGPHPNAKDAAKGEADFAGYGVSFPHQPSRSTQPFAAFRANPDSDRLLLELALLALDHTPRETPAFIAVSLSANDYIGHLFGPDSCEAHDELARLDSALAWFFAELDRRRGPDQWSVVLSADHGIVPLPEFNLRARPSPTHSEPVPFYPRHASERVFGEHVATTARVAAERALGKGTWISAFVEPYLYLSDDALSLPKEKLRRLKVAIETGLSQLPAVERAFDAAATPNPCPDESDESLPALVCRSIKPGRAGDFFVALRPGSFFDTGYVPGFGSNHGNAELACRSVPLLVRSPKKAEAARIEPRPQSFALFAGELSRLLELR